jgi:hypothetical protein
MLFDLQGKRRRVVQVVYAVLAALFFISFVGFGIGSDVSGGIFDAIGIGGGDSSSSSPAYDEEIDQQEQKLAKDPKDTRALEELARLHFLAGQSSLEQDQSGQPIVTDDAKVQFDESAQAWEKYLKLESNPDPNAAGLAVQSYVYLNDAEGAATTQEIVAEDRPSEGAYSNLAFYLYAAADFDAADAAAAKAVAEADGSQKKVVKRQLDQIAEQARKQQKAIEKAQKSAQKNAPEGQNPLQSPLGGTGGLSPTAPTSP